MDLKDWPTTSDFACYDCCAKFKSVPVPMVHLNLEFDKRIIHICVENLDQKKPYPVYCSPNCVSSYISRSSLHQTQLNHNIKILVLFWSQYYQTREKNCSLQIRPRHLLQQFGGSMSVEAYRRGFYEFVDKRPTNQSGIPVDVSVSSISMDDSIYWPIQYPHVLPSIPLPPDKTPLTTVDDPTDRVPPREMSRGEMGRGEMGELKAAAENKTDSEDGDTNGTISLVASVLQQTLNTKQIQDVTSQLNGMTLTGRATTHNPPTTIQPPQNKRRKVAPRDGAKDGPNESHINSSQSHVKSSSTMMAPSDRHPWFQRRVEVNYLAPNAPSHVPNAQPKS
jgi:hypothetical protein